jgi:drug/metabolite transporter (DMT)-like permease
VTARPAGPAGPAGLRVGLAIALLSAATFGSSGAVAKSLILIGWSPAAAVLVRLGGGTVVLTAVALARYGLRWPVRPGAGRTVLAYGAVATAGTQLAYFNAVQRLDVAVALMLEFLAPVLLLVWTSLRRRALPTVGTLIGAVVAVGGLVVVLEPWGAGTLDPVGVLWGLTAAGFLCTFFILGERARDQLPVLVLAAGGTAVGAATMLTAGLVGIVPLVATTAPTPLAGRTVSWLLPAVWLAVVATAVAYLTGISAVTRLGVRVSSFVALVEVLAAVLFAWALLGEAPGPAQVLGGAVLVAGIAAVQRAEDPDAPAGAPAGHAGGTTGATTGATTGRGTPLVARTEEVPA